MEMGVDNDTGVGGWLNGFGWVKPAMLLVSAGAASGLRIGARPKGDSDCCEFMLRAWLGVAGESGFGFGFVLPSPPPEP